LFTESAEYIPFLLNTLSEYGKENYKPHILHTFITQQLYVWFSRLCQTTFDQLSIYLRSPSWLGNPLRNICV